MNHKKYFNAMIDDPHKVMREWFFHRSGNDGAVQLLCVYAIASQYNANPFSMAIEEADFEERHRLVDDTLALFPENTAAIIAAASSAGLFQLMPANVVVSLDRSLDDNWLLGASRHKGTQPLQRAIGAYDGIGKAAQIQCPKVAILLDTDEREMSGAAWRKIFRARMDGTVETIRRRAKARLRCFDLNGIVAEAEWQLTRDALETFFNCVPRNLAVHFDNIDGVLPDVSPEVLPVRAEQLCTLAANIACFRHITRNKQGNAIEGTSEDLVDARKLLLAARVVEDRAVMSPKATEMLAILGAIRHKFKQEAWTIDELMTSLHSLTPNEAAAVEQCLLPPRPIPQKWCSRTLRRHIETLWEFGILNRISKKGNRYEFEISGSGVNYLQPHSLFSFFKLKSENGCDPVTSP